MGSFSRTNDSISLNDRQLGEIMARLKRYDLYEGDGEVIREEGYTSSRRVSSSLPGKQPLGWEEDPDRPRGGEEHPVRSGNRNAGRKTEPQADRRRYFLSREEDDGLGSPAPLFDDFDRIDSRPYREEPGKRKKKKLKHRGAWAALLVTGIVCLCTMGLLVLPQLTGIRYRFLPNLAFVNGNVIQLDEEKRETFEQCKAALFTDTIYPGVYIDGVHVGGLTRAEAAAAVSAAAEQEAAAVFDIIVTVGNQSWHVNSERVPVSRNVEQMVEEAWASGRSSEVSIQGAGITPFQDRVNQASALRSYPLMLETKTDYDHDALRLMADGIVNYVNRDPVNSMVESFDFNTHAFTFSEDQPGAYIDRDELYATLEKLLDGGTTQTTLKVTPQKVLADVTRTELMNRFGLISSYTTKTTKNNNRNTNIDLSAQAINGRTVMPGETFSFNQATGERTAAKGYKEAAAISGGQSRDEIGGGVCQTSSTLFNAVARANLEIVERNPHAWPSSYVEKGFDATVNWPGLDFKFKNNTDWPVFIIASYANREVTVHLYGMSLGADTRIDLESHLIREIPRPEGTEYVINSSLAVGESKVTVTGRKGYEVETWKVWYQGNRETKRELLFKTTYKAYQERVEYNPR